MQTLAPQSSPQITWFAQNRQYEDTPVIQRIINANGTPTPGVTGFAVWPQSQLHALPPGGLVEREGADGEVMPEVVPATPVLLFCRNLGDVRVGLLGIWSPNLRLVCGSTRIVVLLTRSLAKTHIRNYTTRRCRQRIRVLRAVEVSGTFGRDWSSPLVCRSYVAHDPCRIPVR